MDHETQSEKKKKGRLWPILIVGFLTASAGLDLTVLFIAAQHTSLAIEDDYYQRGVDRTAREEGANEAARRGWALDIDVPEHVVRSKAAPLSVALVDAAGAPLPGATIRYRAFPSSRPRMVQEGTLAMVDGVYRGEFDPKRIGQWQFRFEVEHEDVRFEETRTPWIYWVR